MISRTVIALICAGALALGASACGSDDTVESAAPASGTCAGGELPTRQGPGGGYDAPEQVLVEGCEYTAVISTNRGDITVTLDAGAAPTTVNSFVFLATQGYFDGLTFHRVVPGFVIQGGDPTGTGSGGPGYQLPDELPEPEDGAPAYRTGDLAMANAGPGTSGSQFFIVTGDASFLPPAYSLFGAVTDGLEAAQEIEALADPAADPGDPAAQQPTEPAIIESIRITET
jgi:cyclophilin family peptidyl-prolyl cis-trans isomerase